MAAEQGRPVGVHFDGDLRATLLRTAVDLLAERGIEDLSLREVARRAGVSHAAPAHHFGDRTGLLTAIAVEGFERFIDHFATAFERLGTRTDLLPELARTYAEFADAHPGHFDVMFRPGVVRTDDPDYVAVSDAAFVGLQLHLERCQATGWRRGTDSRTLAAASWALAHGIAVLRRQGSLARHVPDASLDGTTAIAAALVDPSGPDPTV